MLYKHLKSLILIIPTLTIGLWEYVRHAFLLPYISMELGNWLAPLLVYFVTMTLLRKLFTLMEQLQEELQMEKSVKAALEEREKMAKELHDGIAQSLFLLSVRVDKLAPSYASATTSPGNPGDAYPSLRKTVREVNEYVRQAIANLRYPANHETEAWMSSVNRLIEDFSENTGIPVTIDWTLEEKRLSVKEKVELYSTMREALFNVYKHAKASQIWLRSRNQGQEGWFCSILDDGEGFQLESSSTSMSGNGYGLMIIQERATRLGWNFLIERHEERTILEIRKGDRYESDTNPSCG
ncbi:sensor histidine kinase [Paenibacillus sp. OAS669]|uniref:sensor histidine kinase n=1 Tax=Paenibacillus sp. OAS669 TaxID=2663821 RepID=UPI00178A9DE1|nr:histidine kinase [Paenibacillus sp. OAS669]MBE1445773.1 two-component system nitrate/nitrite sensor histidine kinase NarQ [Paenibacillus sp. OAS669]